MPEETIERLFFFILGCFFGYVLNIIVTNVRNTNKEVNELLTRDRERDDTGILQHRAAFDIMFALMMVFVFYAAYASFQNSKELVEAQQENQVTSCKAGEETRHVQRRIIDAIYQLAIGAIQPDPKKPFTDKQLKIINSYIDRTNAFRESTYKQIRPTPACMEFVDDDNVEPPTPPQPYFFN